MFVIYHLMNLHTSPREIVWSHNSVTEKVLKFISKMELQFNYTKCKLVLLIPVKKKTPETHTAILRFIVQIINRAPIVVSVTRSSVCPDIIHVADGNPSQ